MVASATAGAAPKITTTKFSFNASTGDLTTTGVVSGSTSFSDVTVSGNYSGASWSTAGIKFNSAIGTHTDTSSAAAAVIATSTVNSFRTPTLDSTNAITVTTGATVRIDGPPTAGVNTTITNPHALVIAAGRTYMAANSVGVPALAIRDVNTGLYSSATGVLDVAIAGVRTASISASGLVVAGEVTAYGALSDIRRKENVELIQNPLEKISKLSGITFNYTNDSNRMTGLIAQELLEVLPEVVYTEKDITTGEEYYTVRYGNVVGLLVEAIKELKSEIEVLKAK